MSQKVITTKLAARALAAAGAAFLLASTIVGCTTARTPIGPDGRPLGQGPAVGSAPVVPGAVVNR